MKAGKSAINPDSREYMIVRRAYRDEVQQQDLRSRPAAAAQRRIALPDRTSLKGTDQLDDILHATGSRQQLCGIRCLIYLHECL